MEAEEEEVNIFLVAVSFVEANLGHQSVEFGYLP